MSVIKVEEGKYRIFISHGTNLDGSRRRFSKTVETDLKGRDLKRFLMEAEFDFEDEVKRKDPKFHELAKGTFKDFSNWWLQYKVIHDDIAPKTRQEYEKFLDTRILPFIGKRILEDITNSDMLDLIKEIKQSPARTKTGKLSDKSIKHYHTLLKTMFNDAMRLKIISENPMENITVKTPTVQLRDNYYNLNDIKKLLDLLPMEDTKYHLATLLALTVGFRVGELTALQWKHIDFKNRRIKIEQSNSYTKEEGSIIKSTKNEYSERTVVFPSSLTKIFQQHKENELLRKELLEDTWEGSKDHKENFVFTQENGNCIFVGTIPKWFRKFIRKNKLKYITFHGLRHTNATILISEGTPVINIAKNLGHAKTSTTTDFYAHHLETVEEKMANTFDNIITGSGSGSEDDKLRLVK